MGNFRPSSCNNPATCFTHDVLPLPRSLPPFPLCLPPRRLLFCLSCLPSSPIPILRPSRPTDRLTARWLCSTTVLLIPLQCRPSHETSGPHCPRLRRPRHALSGPDRACSGQAGQFWVGEMIAAPFLPTTRHDAIISRLSARRVTKRVKRLRGCIISYTPYGPVPVPVPSRDRRMMTMMMMMMMMMQRRWT